MHSSADLEFAQMLRQRIFVLTIAAALILPTVANCLAPAVLDAQTMKCCAELDCPAGHQQACYSTTSPTGGSQSTPELIVALAGPAAVDHAAALPALVPAENVDCEYSSDARLHSPPDLYTVHNSLLI